MTTTDMTAREFLTHLWGEELPNPRLRIQTWTLASKRTLLLRAPVGATGVDGRPDVYTCVALTHDQRTTGRPTAADSRAVAGLWLDIDVNGGPDNKTGAAPSAQAALDLAQAILPPTLLVSSGHGLHAWWLLLEPWVFANRQEQHDAAVMAAQWFELHRRVAIDRGFTVDHAHDLARLMRLPGTINAKGGRRAAVTGRLVGARWTQATLDDLCHTVPAPTMPAGRNGQVAQVAVTVHEGAALDPGKLAAALHNLPDFAATWNHERPVHWSLSEYDLALCAIAGQLDDWTDQDLADLIVHHRNRWQPESVKASRPDYLQRTIALARSDRALRAAAYGGINRAAGARGEQLLNQLAMTRNHA